jgi:hypothetical protein
MTNDSRCNPAEYRRHCARHAEKLTLLGATRAELAVFFGVDVLTIERWAEQHKDFEWALQVPPTTLMIREDFGLINWLKDYRFGNLDV